MAGPVAVFVFMGACFQGAEKSRRREVQKACAMPSGVADDDCHNATAFAIRAIVAGELTAATAAWAGALATLRRAAWCLVARVRWRGVRGDGGSGRGRRHSGLLGKRCACDPVNTLLAHPASGPLPAVQGRHRLWKPADECGRTSRAASGGVARMSGMRLATSVHLRREAQSVQRIHG